MVAAQLVIVMAVLLMSMMAMVGVFAARFKKVPPGHAMVIYGRRMSPQSRVGYRVITGGGKFILPIVESYELMDLQSQKVELDFRDVKVVDGGADRIAHARASATLRISDNPDSLKVAAEHLLHVTYRDIGRMSRNVFEAHLRGVLRTTPFGDASGNPVRTAAIIKVRMEQDLMNIGIVVDDLTVQELKLRGE